MAKNSNIDAAPAPNAPKKMQNSIEKHLSAVVTGIRAPSERKSKTSAIAMFKAILPGRKGPKAKVPPPDANMAVNATKDSLPTSRKRTTSNGDLKTTVTVKRAKVDAAVGNVNVLKSVRKHKNVAPEYEPAGEHFRKLVKPSHELTRFINNHFPPFVSLPRSLSSSSSFPPTPLPIVPSPPPAKPETRVDIKTWPPKRSANARKVAAVAAEKSRCIVAPHDDDDVSTSDEQYAAELAAELEKPSLPRQKAAARPADDDEADNDSEADEDDAEDQYELESDAAMDEDDDDEGSIGSSEVPSWTSQLREDSTELPESFTADYTGTSASRNATKFSATALFDSDKNVQTVKSNTKRSTAAQLKKKAMEEPVFDDTDDMDSQAGDADVDDRNAEQVFDNDDGDSIPEDDGERSGHGNDGNNIRSYRRGKVGGGGDGGGGGGGNVVDNNGHWWPAWTNLVLTPRGTANLLAQAPAIRRILDRAIRLVEEEFAFVKGYPEADGRSPFLHDALRRACMLLDDVSPILLQRIMQDQTYWRALIVHPGNRLSHRRSDIKDEVVPRIVPALSLAPTGALLPPTNIQAIIKRSLAGRAFIFPTNPEDCTSIVTLKVYHNLQ
ncbi:hypothetical protein EUX98_g7857 [Antrodiella citrinella]|uniref:Uncharacterized protein n=1 Tax=Antrodiella citrinella TaxID=2447956 RepID=A0A4S4MM69_9APHY|nr:hypothetical protein EUX98_g7857 [Antrodiella citrinella]